MTTIEANLLTVRQRIDHACKLAGRDVTQVTLLAVSKTFSPEAVRDAVSAGQPAFGENYVQEGVEKLLALRELAPDAAFSWHCIGPLQSNKARVAMQMFDAIHSVDRPKLVDTLARLADELGRCPDLFLQVNTGAEPQKAGVLPDQVDGLVAQARELSLPVRGLMCIPPVDEPAGPHFTTLAGMAARNGLVGLSMGMSDDFEQAIAAGATHIGVGSAIFGARVAG